MRRKSNCWGFDLAWKKISTHIFKSFCEEREGAFGKAPSFSFSAFRPLSAKSETKNHPLCGWGNKGYTKKSPNMVQ